VTGAARTGGRWRREGAALAGHKTGSGRDTKAVYLNLRLHIVGAWHEDVAALDALAMLAARERRPPLVLV